MNLRSDNNAGLIPEARAGLLAAAEGHAVGYGDDPFTDRAIAALRDLFGAQTEVFFVATGTAANTLAIASLTEPWQRVLCHRESHWYEDESTAPERITLCRSTPISPRTDPTRLAPEDLEPVLARPGGVHHPAPGVLTLTNTTELGTLYSPAQLAALTTLAHNHDYRVHVDGARFANAVAQLMTTTGIDPAAACRALTVDAGIDALSLGGTKAGLAYGEAILLFPQVSPAAARAAQRLPFLRKSTGHLLSKHRFITGPFAHALADHAWLRHAAHANAMAEHLARGLTTRGLTTRGLTTRGLTTRGLTTRGLTTRGLTTRGLTTRGLTTRGLTTHGLTTHGLTTHGLTPSFPREANVVFVDLPPALDAHLQARGHGYYPFPTPLGTRARLMCSFATTAAELDAFLADID